MRSRHGIALFLVICVILVLAAFAGVLRLLTHSAAVEVDAVTAHVRAVAVGELAFAEVVARLGATAWRDRWFRAAPDVTEGMPAGGGVYSYLLRDTPAPVALGDPLADAALGGPAQADLLVRATYGRASVVMFWRLTVPQDSLDNVTTVVPTYFGFGPETAQPTPADADPLSAQVNQGIRDRQRNGARAGPLAGPLGQATGAGAAGTLLGADPGPGAVEGVPPPGGAGGGPPRPAPPPGGGGLPGNLAPVDPTLDGMWVSDYQDIPVSATDPTLHHARDYVQVKQTGDVVTGRVQFIDDAGAVWTEWDFTTTRAGNRIVASVANLRTLITGASAPSGLTAVDLIIDATSSTMTGTYTWPGGSRPARYTRYP